MKKSVVAVTTHILFESAPFGGVGQPSKPLQWSPVNNGLFDPRMGPTDASGVCTTCGKKGTKCLGHFGHISLSMPLFGGKVRQLPVPPPLYRPFKFDMNQSKHTHHHKLTHQLSEILVLNHLLRQKQKQSSAALKKLEQLVSMFLYTWLVDSTQF